MGYNESYKITCVGNAWIIAASFNKIQQEFPHLDRWGMNCFLLEVSEILRYTKFSRINYKKYK